MYKPVGIPAPTNWANRIFTCMFHNPDGAGYAVRKAGKNEIIVHKGFFKASRAVEAIEKLNLSDQDEFVFHARIKTHGPIEAKACHPYIISQNLEEVVRVEGVSSKPVLVHNGIFTSYFHHPSYSDSAMFANKFLSQDNFNELLQTCPQLLEDLFPDYFSHNKVVVLFPKRSGHVFNRHLFITDKSGVLFSNSSYLFLGEKAEYQQETSVLTKEITSLKERLKESASDATSSRKTESASIQLEISRKYGAYRLRKTGLCSWVTPKMVTIREKLPTTFYVIPDKRNTRPKFVFSQSHPFFSAGKPKPKDTLDKYNVTYIPQSSQEHADTFSIMQVFITGVQLKNNRTNLISWYNPVELPFKFNISVKS